MTEKRFKYIGNGIYWDNVKETDVGTGEVVRLANDMHEEIQELKRQLSMRKVTTEDIIGIVKTDEPTNSVELKKELYK